MSEDQAAEGWDVPNPKYDAERAAARERWAAASEEERIAGLRAWAKGAYGLEAAVELVIRAMGGRLLFLMECNDDRFDGLWSWIEWATVPERIGRLSGGEQRLALTACSLAGVHPEGFSLGDVAGLDRDNLALVLAAISHAAGTHEQRLIRPVQLADGRVVHAQEEGYAGPLFPWPGEDA